MKLHHILIPKGIVSIIVYCCIITTAPAILYAAQKSVTESEQGTLSGDYVIYRDYSWKTPTWFGFLYYDDETYGAFIYSPEKNSTVSILFSGQVKNGTLILTGQQIISPITPDDTLAVNYLMNLLPKLYELRTMPHSNTAPFGTADVHTQMEEFGGAVDLRFQSFIPLFHLATMTGTKKETILEFAETGSIKENGETAFYGFTPPEFKSDSNTFKRNKKAKKETITISGITLNLDSQWKKIADNSFLCGDTAFLTVTDINIPPSAEGKQPLSESEQILRLLTSSSPYAKTLLPYTVIEGTEAAFTVRQSVYDVASKKVTKDIKRCIKNKDGTFTIISLTVNSLAYHAEQTYFDGLF